MNCNWWMIIVASFIVFARISHADQPPAAASQPATRPAPPLDDRNSVAFAWEGKPISIRLFKGWKVQPVSGETARAWIVPPIPRDSSKPINMFMLAVVGGEKSDVTMVQYASMVRDAIRKRSPDVEFIRDEQTPLAGAEGWVLVYNHTQGGTVSDGQGNTRRVQHAVRTQRLLSRHGAWSATIDFTTTPEDFERLSTSVRRVCESFKWTD